MPVTLDLSELAEALDDADVAEADLAGKYATAVNAIKVLIDRHAPGAPDDVSNAAYVRGVAWWLYSAGVRARRVSSDTQSVTWGPIDHDNILRKSGALMLLSTFRHRRAMAPVQQADAT